MIPLKEDLINYKLEKSDESLCEAKILAKASHWNTVASRLYYAVYYSVNALLISLDLKFKTHSGVKSLFHHHFIKNGKMDEVHGTLYNALFNLRQIGDYEAFQKFSREDIEPYIFKTEIFLELVKRFLQKK
jgi:uncharacterized protein (UPF0332 family)